MAAKYPYDGFNGFALIYGQDVIYSSVSDATVHMPRQHPEKMMYTPFGFLVPFEQTSSAIMQALQGNHSKPQVFGLAPLITDQAEVYAIEVSVQRKEVDAHAQLLLAKGDDSKIPMIFSTDMAVRNVIATCLHITGDVEAMLDHVVKYHGCRRQYVVRTTVGALANECYRRQLNSHIEGIYYGCLAD